MTRLMANSGEVLDEHQLIDREVREIQDARIGRTGIIVGTMGSGVAVRWDGTTEITVQSGTHLVIFEKRDDRVITMLEQHAFERDEFLRQLSEERGELERVVSEAHAVAERIKSGARSANEAAGWIAGEAASIRRA